MRKAVRQCILGLLCVLLGCSAARAQEQPPARVVVDEVVEQQVSSTQSVIGVLYYERRSEISSEFPGIVETVEVREGDMVKAGDVLLRLDTEILEQEIALTRTRIAQIELRIANTRKDFERLEKLFREAGASEKAYDDALFAYQDAVKEKQAAENTLRKLLIQQERSQIRAPYDGMVLTKDTEIGGWVQQGSRLFTLGADLYVRAPIGEDLLQYVRPGEKVEVVINAYDRKLEGTLVGIDPVADVTTKNVFLKINIPYQPLIALNMSATVHVAAAPERKLSVLKRAAVVKHQGGDFIYTIRDGKAAILPVKIVAYLGDLVGVDSPAVAPGMQVIVEGNERLRPEQPVVAAEGR